MQPYVISYPHDHITCSAATMFNELITLYDCRHVLGFPHLPIDAEGAIVVFHGQQESVKPRIGERLSDYARDLRWVIFVSIGDEGCDFPYSDLDHPNMRLWVQTPKPGKVKADRYLIEGYHPSTQAMLHSLPAIDRDLSWFFAGQVNHARRVECVNQLAQFPHGTLVSTLGFQQGMPLEEYYRHMRRARIVPCPAGPLTPDSFRFAEALEAGAVPILDGYAPDGIRGYWNMVLGDHPFAVLYDWSDLSYTMNVLLDSFERQQRLTQFWWKSWKLKMRQQWLPQDLAALGACKLTPVGGVL